MISHYPTTRELVESVQRMNRELYVLVYHYRSIKRRYTKAMIQDLHLSQQYHDYLDYVRLVKLINVQCQRHYDDKRTWNNYVITSNIMSSCDALVTMLTTHQARYCHRN